MAGRKRDLHGSAGMYTNKKCRCDKCKMAHRDAARDYRAKKKAARQEKDLAASNPKGEF